MPRVAFFLWGKVWRFALSLPAILARRKRDLFVCDRMLRSLFMPFGTALGVFTIVLLSRESVKAVFNAAAAGCASAMTNEHSLSLTAL